MSEAQKSKIKLYSIIVAVCIAVILLLVCFYQLKQYDRSPHFNAAEGIVAVRRVVKNDLDYLQMKDNLYLYKEGNGAKLFTEEFVSYEGYNGETNPNDMDDMGGNIFKDAAVVTKDGKTMKTYEGELVVPEGKFYFLVLKDA